jgi:hypothetical protein
MNLTLKQTAALDILEDNVTTELLFGGGAGGGKSALGCYWQLKRRLKYPGTRGLIGRETLKTLKDTTLVTLFEIAKMQGLISGKHYTFNGQSNSINFFNGSVILLKDLGLYPSDPNFDELGSLELTDLFIDEANQVTEKARNVAKSRIRFKLDENGLIPKSLYSCNPAKNWVYQDFYRPHKEGLLTNERQFIQSLEKDNPYISKHYRANLLALDANSRERLLHGNWEYLDDPTILIEYDKIIDSFTNDHVPDGTKYLTIDVARFGSDSTVIGIWSGYRVKFVQYRGKSVQEVADIIRGLQRELGIPQSQTIADEDGVGGGVVDILKCKGFVNNSRALINPITHQDENFSNLKSQCYFKLAEYMNEGKIYMDCKNIVMRESIVQELEQVKQYNMDKDGKRQVLPKDKVKELIGRSPDFSDTLMMRMWFELAPKFRILVG